MSRKDKNTSDKFSKSTLVILITLGAVVGWIAVAIVVGLITQGKNFAIFAALGSGLSDYRVWTIFVCAAVGIAVAFAMREMRSSKRVLKVNDLEDSHWLTNEEIVKSDALALTTYSKLGDVADGMPLYVDKQGRDLTIVLATKPIHTGVIGTTGSGKTSGFVDPVIQILCRTKTKPGLVITDPKGEIHGFHAATLKAMGYDVHVIDLCDPYRSARWNPFAAVIDKTRQIGEAEKLELIPIEVVQDKGKYIYDAAEYDTFEQANAEADRQGRYIFGGKKFKTYEKADTERKVFIQKLCDEIFIDLQDIVYTICPVTSQQEPVWEQGARNFILGLTVAMWEDLRDGGCREEEFNLHTLYKNITTYATGEMNELRSYLTSDRGMFSQAEGLAQTVLTSTDRTLSSYLSQVNSYMINFADSGIRRLTSGNDIELGTFDEKPTALFIKIPDEKENRHFLATLFVTQMYKVLVDKARKNEERGETKTAELKRNVYMIMDEFGNMPKFPSIDRIITVGRSRHIFLCPIIQDFNQLDNKYGKETAGTIKSNCNITVYIGTTDMPTAEEISKRCGNKKQRHISFNDGTGTSGSFSVSTAAEAKPLVYPEELLEWNRPPDKVGNAIVLQFGAPPFKSKYLPVYKAKKLYRPESGKAGEQKESELFDEQYHYYNFLAREEWIKTNEAALAELEKERERILAMAFNKSTDLGAPTDVDGGIGQSLFEQAKERLMPLSVKIVRQLPKVLGNKFESAFFDGSAQDLIEMCGQVLEYADKTSDRWLKADVAKFKNMVTMIANHFEEQQEQGDEYD